MQTCASNVIVIYVSFAKLLCLNTCMRFSLDFYTVLVLKQSLKLSKLAFRLSLGLFALVFHLKIFHNFPPNLVRLKQVLDRVPV